MGPYTLAPGLRRPTGECQGGFRLCGLVADITRWDAGTMSFILLGGLTHLAVIAQPNQAEQRTAKASRELPTPYGVFSIIYDGKFIAHRPISATRFMSIMRDAASFNSSVADPL